MLQHSMYNNFTIRLFNVSFFFVQGQQVFVQTNEHESYHGVLESISSNGDILLSVAHRLHNNQNNDSHGLPTTPIDLIDTIDSSAQTFELQKRTILGSNIVEIIAIDVDLAGQNKCKFSS